MELEFTTSQKRLQVWLHLPETHRSLDFNIQYMQGADIWQERNVIKHIVNEKSTPGCPNFNKNQKIQLGLVIGAAYTVQYGQQGR